MPKKKKLTKPPPSRGVGRPLGAIDESTLAGQLGAKIRAGRIKRGMTITNLAESLDVPEATLRHWERGRRCLPIGQAMAVCAALGLRIEELVASD